MKKAPPKTTPLTVGELRKRLRGLNPKADIIKWSEISGEYTRAFKVVEFGKGRNLKGLEIQFY